MLGGAAGLALGIVFTWGIMNVMLMDMTLTPSMVMVAVLSAAVVGFFFGMYPAVKASRLDPVEALQVEAMHFTRSITDGETSPSDGQAGLRVVKILEAATRSLHERGRPVKLGWKGRGD